jgi:hypothetical protein
MAAEQRRAVGRDGFALEGEIVSLREAIAVSRAKLKEELGSVQRHVKDCWRQSQE